MPTTSLDTTADAEGAAAPAAAGAAIAVAAAVAGGGQPGAAAGGATTFAEAQLTSTEALGGEGATKGANAEGGEGGGHGHELKCSCRNSRCVLLYCACYASSTGCGDDCKCKSCDNPNGPHPRAKAEKKLSGSKRKAPPVPSLLVLTVSPGRLGLTLTMLAEGGAEVTGVDPACTFRGQICVGDRIVSIDGRKVEKMADLAVGKERVRKFGVLKPQSILQGGSRKVDDAGHNNRKQTFPYLRELGADGTGREAEHRREDLMTELLQWDKRNGVNTTAKMGPARYQLIAVPLKRRETVNKRELDNQCFHQYNKQTKLFDKFLNAWGSYCSGTQEDAANMILYYMAKRFPQSYVKNFAMASKKNDKLEGNVGAPPVELPPDFVSYDGTNDVKWNTRYAELVEFKEKNGNCKVYSKTALGKFVTSQRTAKRSQAKSLSPKRIELLENLGFQWCGLPEGYARPVPGGDPRQNRAIAARLVYPELTMREVLELGGFLEEELSAIKDQRHHWRTGFVYYKDQVNKRVDNYPTARRTGARLEIEKLVTILNGEEVDRAEQVFGEYARFLPGFLEAAEERKRNGITEKPRRSRSRKKRAEGSTDNQAVVGGNAMVGEERDHPAPLAADPTAGVHAMEFPAPAAYDPGIANPHPQQVWRQQDNYWR